LRERTTREAVVQFTKSIKIEAEVHQALKLFCVARGLRIDATANEAIKRFLREAEQVERGEGLNFDPPDIPKL
jgi:hypothetical protein